MPDWLVSNGSTVIIALILLAMVFFAVRKVLRNKGGCSCGHCDGCDGCSAGNDEEKD